MAIDVVLPGALAEAANGERHLTIDLPGAATVADLLDALDRLHPALHRRLRDETGALRRFVNIYLDGEDIRRTDGLATTVRTNSTVQILPSVAGGAG
jgi:molybdopterin synthase sulfur carrier subunit